MAKKTKSVKPMKKSDADLFKFIEGSIADAKYIFTKHAKLRSSERKILETTVLDILENKSGRKRRRNKKKDKFEMNALDWSYCIEGEDVNADKIRVIITFEKDLMPIITVMWV